MSSDLVSSLVLSAFDPVEFVYFLLSSSLFWDYSEAQFASAAPTLAFHRVTHLQIRVALLLM